MHYKQSFNVLVETILKIRYFLSMQAPFSELIFQSLTYVGRSGDSVLQFCFAVAGLCSRICEFTHNICLKSFSSLQCNHTYYKTTEL